MTGPDSCTGARATLLAEVNLLIDYCESGNRTVLSLVAERIGPLAVVSTVLDGVRDINTDECTSLGIGVVEPTPEQLERATCVDSPVSFSDRICLVVCREEGWTCVTNDPALKRLCERSEVPTRFGLNLLVDLVATGAITRRRAAAVARRIRAVNPSHIDDGVLSRFLVRLDPALRN